MKRWTAFLITLILMFQFAIVHASSVPGQTGFITDPINLLTSEQKKMIEQRTSGERYELFILTGTKLSEEEGLKLANQAYEEWGLTADQLLLVITTSDNYVHLVFDNIHLKDAVESSVAKNVKGVIDRTFVPLAGQGKITEGIIEVSRWINNLQPVETNANIPVPQKPTNQGNSEAKPDTKEGMSLWRVLFPIIFLLVLFYFISRLWTGLRNRKFVLQQIRILNGSLKETVSQLSQTLLSDVFRELELGFFKGKTKDKLNELEQEALQLQKQSELWQGNLDQFNVPVLVFSDKQQELQRMAGELSTFAKQVVQLHSSVNEAGEISKRAARKIEAMKEKDAHTMKLLKALAEQTNYSLTHLKDRWEQASQLVREADDMDEFDPVGAEVIISKAEQALDSLQSSIKELEEQISDFRRITLLEDATRRELKEQIRREQLLLIDGDPVSTLDKAKQLLIQAEQKIVEGNTIQARKDLDTLEQIISEAKKKLTEILRHRDESIHMITTIERILTEGPHYKKCFLIEMNKVKQKYDEIHWEEQTYRQVQWDYDALHELVGKLKPLVDPGTQRYSEAYELTERAKWTIQQLEEKKQKCLSRFNELESALFNASMQLTMQKNRIQGTWDQLKKENIPFSQFAAIAEKAGERALDVQKETEKIPINLNVITAGLHDLKVIANEFIQFGNQLLAEKQKVINLLNQYQTNFWNEQQKFSSKINTSKQTASFNQSINDIEKLVLSGDYAGAAARIATAYVLIDQMRKDYLRKAAKENQRYSGGSGWGGGSSSGRSSGSSGWGGGSSSGRSSGSSGWGGGSSSGRSSGSSKW